MIKLLNAGICILFVIFIFLIGNIVYHFIFIIKKIVTYLWKKNNYGTYSRNTIRKG